MWRYTLLVVVAVYCSLSTVAYSQDASWAPDSVDWYDHVFDLREDTLYHIEKYTEQGYDCKIVNRDGISVVDCSQGDKVILLSQFSDPERGEYCRTKSVFTTCAIIDGCDITMNRWMGIVEKYYQKFIVARGFEVLSDPSWYQQCYLSKDRDTFCLMSNTSDHLSPITGFYLSRTSNCS